MRIGQGREYAVAYDRPNPEYAFLNVSDISEYKGVFMIYGTMSNHSVHITRGIKDVRTRPSSFALTRNEPDGFIHSAVKKLRGERLFVTDLNVRPPDYAYILNLMTCRYEKCGGKCDRYHGPINPRDWTLEHHRKKNVWMIDKFLEWKAAGELTAEDPGRSGRPSGIHRLGT